MGVAYKLILVAIFLINHYRRKEEIIKAAVNCLQKNNLLETFFADGGKGIFNGFAPTLLL